ncbi:MAG: hypothetical protein CMM01_05425 [Rhodopirellula sp.]|nr:hypothetical protein [Rhodopirellula sp.]
MSGEGWERRTFNAKPQKDRQFSSQTCRCVAKRQQYNHSNRMVDLNRTQPIQTGLQYRKMDAPTADSLCHIDSNLQHKEEIQPSH